MVTAASVSDTSSVLPGEPWHSRMWRARELVSDYVQAPRALTSGAGHGLVPPPGREPGSRALCDIQSKMQHMAGIDPDPHWDWNLTANSRTATCEVPILPMCCVQGSCSPAGAPIQSHANPEPATYLLTMSRPPNCTLATCWPFDDTTPPFPVPQSGAHRSRTSESARACLTHSSGPPLTSLQISRHLRRRPKHASAPFQKSTLRPLQSTGRSCIEPHDIMPLGVFPQLTF